MRNRNHNADTSATIKRMTEEVYQLAEEQAKALKKATFLGMPAEVANECDSRRARIRRLVRELEHLQHTKEHSE